MRRSALVHLDVSDELLERLEGIATRHYPREVMASLHGFALRLGDGRLKIRVSSVMDTYIEMVNRSSDKVVFRLERRAFVNPTWMGFWHTHPDGSPEPSDRDIRVAADIAREMRAREAGAPRPVVLGITAIRMKPRIVIHAFYAVDASGSIVASRVMPRRSRISP